ncbi:cell envelope integrity protein CreD [Sphingomonas sp. SUN039]|uniref:cell envelope integrity protein CreD n=1 Tax=Sphingomonas sp. SUN039 TaxID=2937787 RepID=UPI002164BFF3|nr:cell envelope integrity protein CreD [Sphingomonas sp. SUN039]UVO54310.1 cell envelope integrity protein CreD [Sphingomonas sp. SUN039]
MALPPATPVFRSKGGERSPGVKLALVILVGLLLAVPLVTVWALVYDRQNQSTTAQASIVEGWGGPQVIAGPVLVVPYQAQTTETVEEGGKQVTKTSTVWKEMALSPETAQIDAKLDPSRRKRSIYEAVVYEARLTGSAQFAMPADLSRLGIDAKALVWNRAELRFGLSNARGLFGPPPVVRVGGKAVVLEPGHGLGATGNSGFFAGLDASGLPSGPIAADFDYRFRGNASLTLAPRAGDTQWHVTSSWPSPSFGGGFLPVKRGIGPAGFDATYRVGNLALGQALVDAEDKAVSTPKDGRLASLEIADGSAATSGSMSISLIQPIDLYDQVNRATKYGFLFIGFTFLAFLMFDVIGGVRVSTVEYLLVGAALVLFFVLLLAFAEVVGFTLAYLIAGAGIIGLITAYSAAVLKSWRRAAYIAGLLTALYAVLYILLSLEAYSLLIGSLMLFVALAAVMYVTRRLDWGARRGEETAAPPPQVTA